MLSTEPLQQNNHFSIPPEATLRRIRFVPKTVGGAEPLLVFPDPNPQQAQCVTAENHSPPSTSNANDDGGIDILTLPGQPREQLEWSDGLLNWAAATPAPGAAPPIAITLHGAQITWTSSRAAILAPPDRTESFLLALVDFSFYERELRKLEREVGESWSLLEQDAPLAHTVSVHDPDRFEDIGRRMEETLTRRMRLARIGPHLYQPRPHYSPLANQLLDRLREKSHVEDRLEALGAKLDVFERVYELNGQRISEFKFARQGHTLEWMIIVLLAAETILLAIDVLWTLGI